MAIEALLTCLLFFVLIVSLTGIVLIFGSVIVFAFGREAEKDFGDPVRIFWYGMLCLLPEFVLVIWNSFWPIF